MKKRKILRSICCPIIKVCLTRHRNTKKLNKRGFVNKISWSIRTKIGKYHLEYCNIKNKKHFHIMIIIFVSIKYLEFIFQHFKQMFRNRWRNCLTLRKSTENDLLALIASCDLLYSTRNQFFNAYIL